MASKAPRKPRTPKAAKGKGAANADGESLKDDGGTERSISSRERLRGQLSCDVEAFLSGGGSISHIDPHVTADPPKKPDSNYGSRPI